MSNYGKKLIVKPGSKIRLKHFDPGYHGKHESHKSALLEIQESLQKMDAVAIPNVRREQAFASHCVAGTRRCWQRWRSPSRFEWHESGRLRLYQLQGTDERELAHDFLWRVHPHVPAKGSIAIFNRSHYEDVLVVRVHGLAPEKVWSKRYDQINDFERLIATENNTTILKFFLHISKEEQLARFKKRLDDPDRQWKISDSDYKEREYWGDYIEGVRGRA